MEAHARLANKGYNVLSFGTGDKIKLPGPSASQPNVYEFGTLYSEIWADLVGKDEAMYKQSGILHMLDRNRTIKPAPERLQDSHRQFDLILTAEERVFDQVLLLLLSCSLHPLLFLQVLEHFAGRGGGEEGVVHVVNMDIQDNQEEATIGAFFFHEMVQLFSQSTDLDNEIDEILQDFEVKCKRPLLHSVLFY